MTLESFFEKFDLFADAPDAVAKMRELVRHLAVEGKLVSQDPKDEPASDLIRRLEAARERLAAEQGVRPPKNVPALTSPDYPHDIPKSWQWCRIGHLAVVIDYGTSQKSDSDSSKVPIYRMGNIIGGRLVDENLKYVDASIDDLPALYLKTHDILFNRTNSYELVGKTGIFTGRDNTATFASYLIRIRLPDTLLLPTFFSLAMNAPYFRQTQIEPEIVQQCGQANFNGTKLASTIVPLPPLAEQKRIVAKVDELMALCDRLEAQQQEREEQASQLARASLARFADAPTPANLEYLFHSSFIIPPSSLRRSILTLAVQGKLVPQDPNDEPAEEIVAGIAGDVAKAVRAKRMRNSRPIPAYEDEFPFDLPVGWTWAPLGTLTAAEDGAMCDGPFGSKLKTEHYIPTKGFAVLRLGNIGVGYFIHGKEGHISREHFESLPSNHTAPGDLLVAGLADPLVRCCEIPPDIGPAVNKSDCFRVRVSERMERSYVRHYLNSPIAKAFAAEENHGMTRERINLANAKALPVSIPPLAEQRRIVAKVEQLMALVDALETQLAASRATAANLFSALVAELTAG